MRTTYRARSFKSGNSIAIRIPAALKIEAGQDFTVEEEEGGLVIRPAAPNSRSFPVDTIWGLWRGRDARPLTPDERLIEGRDLPWHLLDGAVAQVADA